MKNIKSIFRTLQDSFTSGTQRGCGIDDDELKTVADRLDKIDCGMNDIDLKRAVEQFKALPIEKRAEIAYALIEHKLYEESICRRYGITRATMYRWMEKGKLPHEFRHDGEGKKFLYASECDEAVEKFVG